jgi:hypothetical protein
VAVQQSGKMKGIADGDGSVISSDVVAWLMEKEQVGALKLVILQLLSFEDYYAEIILFRRYGGIGREAGRAGAGDEGRHGFKKEGGREVHSQATGREDWWCSGLHAAACTAR